MKMPLSWLREFTPVPKDILISDLESAFVKVGFEVESIELVGSDVLGPLVVGKVLSIEELTEHKKPIRYVGLDCGESETRFVICGASNFEIGNYVVVALPGAVLPGNFEISARETYGRVSNGMICSAKELRLGEDHSGIIVLPINAALPGSNARELLELDDLLIDVSILADRGYALSARGLARELAGSLNLPFQEPADLDCESILVPNSGTAVDVIIEDLSGADYIAIRTFENVNVSSDSPIWMQRRLQKCGMRPISLAVDITNYVMLELGQPLHAFDAKKIVGSIRIRRALSGEEFTTLDGVLRKLEPDNLLVCDDKYSLALAGTMGGLDSEVTATTSSIALEAAHFDPISIAKNSRTQRISSEASRRFERSVDPRLVDIASARAASLLMQFGGAKYIDTKRFGSLPKEKTIFFKPVQINALLGYDYSAEQISEALTTVGCRIISSSNIDLNSNWQIGIPSWRPDLLVISDLSEEVARINGLELIPSHLPTGKRGAQLSPMQLRRRSIGQMLANSGFSEVLTSPFISPEINKTLGFVGDRAKSFRLANPMSEEFPLLRTHLTPGLLLAAKRNLSRGAKDISIFEIGSIFRNTEVLHDMEEVSTDRRPAPEILQKIFAGVPKQPTHVAGVVIGQSELSGWWGSGRTFQWSDAIAMAVRIVEETGNIPEIAPSEFAPWHVGRCAELTVAGRPVAHAGELHPRVLEDLGLPPRGCAFVVAISEIPIAGTYKAQSVWTMPLALQDISLIVDSNVSALDVQQALQEGAGELLESIALFDRYDQIEAGKVSLAYKMSFRAPDRTLTALEVSEFRKRAGEFAAERCGAIIRV